MARTKQRRDVESQQEALRVAAETTGTISPVLVGGQWYDREVEDGRVVMVLPGVDGTDVAPAIPERRVPCAGISPVAEISIKQMNRYIAAQVPFITALTGWSIALDGLVVYGGMAPTGSAVTALIEAAAALPRLLALPVRIWIEDDWQDRQVYLDGRAATITHLLGSSGTVRLAPVEAGAFGEDVTDLDIDLLTDRIWWWPRTTETEASPDD